MPSYNYGNLAEKPATQTQVRTRGVNHGKRSLSDKKNQLNRKLRMRCFLLAGLVAAMCIFTIFCRSFAAQKGYELVEMKQSVSTLQRENARLKLDIAKLKTPSRIKTIAVTKLGMVLPPKIYFANQNH